MLDTVGLADRADDPAKSLPYGARRALEIAVALACRPKLLFLDEPTAGLGSDGRARLAELVGRLKGAAHHRHHRARHGVPVLARRRDLGDPLGPGDRARHARPSCKANPWVKASNLGRLALMLEVAPSTPSTARRRRCSACRCRCGAGEVLALLGANGAGKTTVLRSILGLTRPRRGDIRFQGQSIAGAPTHEIARAGIGWVPDDRRLCPTLTVAKNLSLGDQAHALPPLDAGGGDATSSRRSNT